MSDGEDDFVRIGNGQWLKCSNRACKHPTVPVSVVAGRTYIINGQVFSEKALVICGVCGTIRDFKSGPAPADAQRDSDQVASLEN